MIPSPLAALAIALGAALASTIAVFVYTDRRSRPRIARLRSQRPACIAPQPRVEAPCHRLPRAAPGLRLTRVDVARPLPRTLHHQGHPLTILVRVRRPRRSLRRSPPAPRPLL